ncbi:MAG: hypothetical protein PHI31_06395 [Desulfuromonadaceae bacterium]|nr:hypothetical protein [Desulfuromonadaceae bacterium]
MEANDHTDPQDALVKRVHRCIKRYKKIEKILKQPWRNKEFNSGIQSSITLLNDLVFQVTYDEERSNALLMTARFWLMCYLSPVSILHFVSNYPSFLFNNFISKCMIILMI